MLILTALGAIYWLLQLALTLRVVKSVPSIEDMPLPQGSIFQKVSCIMTACNEADSIEQAMKTRLQEDYPNIEFILVEDRSTDRTPELADQIASQDRRVKVVHIKELPPGWLGKLNAMNTGVKHATGDWLLFSDVDVFVKRGAVARTISYCEARGLDHLPVIPEAFSATFLVDVVLSAFVRMLCLAARVWDIEDPDSDAAIGSGSFNLVRRSAYDKAKGFEWLKMEPGDDVALGQMLKQSGARCSVANGRNWVGVYFYKSLRAMAEGVERAGFTGIGNFSFARILALSLGLGLLEASPFLALAPIGVRALPFISVTLILIAFAVSSIVNIWAGRKIIPGFFFPVAIAIMAFLLIRAGYFGAKRGGIYWRGTFYSNRELKAGKRIKIP